MAPTTLPSPQTLLSIQDTHESFLYHTTPATESLEIEKTARRLGDDIILFSLNDPPPTTSLSTAVTMRRTVTELSVKHDFLFNGMMNRLDPTPDNIEELFNGVADEIFRDMQYNWGRVVTLYAFAGRLAKHLHKKGFSDCANNMMGKIVGDFVTRKLQPWICKNGGWAAFEDHFPSHQKSQDSLWKGLVVTVMGLGALATMVQVAVR